MKRYIRISIVIIFLAIGVTIFYVKGSQLIINNDPIDIDNNMSQNISSHENFNNTATEDDFLIAGINVIKAKPQEVVSLYGEPQSKKNNGVWHYPDFDILFSGYEIEQYSINNDKYETARGIKIGDPVTKVVERYGENKLGTMKWYSYSSGMYPYRIDFQIENEKVIQILISLDMWAEPGQGDLL